MDSSNKLKPKESSLKLYTLVQHTILPSIPSQSRRSDRNDEFLKSRVKCTASLDKLPDYVLLNIFLHLNPGDLLAVASTCNRLYGLASENFIWKKIYKFYKFGKVKDEEKHTSCNFWKLKCIKEAKDRRLKIANKKPVIKNLYTGLIDSTPIINKLKISWILQLIDCDGYSIQFTTNDFYAFKTSYSIRWFKFENISLLKLKRIKIFASLPLFIKSKCDVVINSKTTSKSLIYDEKFDWSVIEKALLVKSENINLHNVSSELFLACWGDTNEAAFWHFLLPNSNVLERCLKGFSIRKYSNHSDKPVFENLVLENMLYNYTCIIEIRNQRKSLFCERFRSIIFNAELSNTDWIAFPLVTSNDYFVKILTPLDFLWKTEFFTGRIKNFVIVDILLTNGNGYAVINDSTLTNIKELNDYTVDYACDKLNKVMRFVVENEFYKLEMRFAKEDDTVDSYKIKNEITVRECILYISKIFSKKLF